MAYRVVYGETMPAWEKTFATLREARAFAKKHESFGDVIFSIGPVRADDRPQSLTGIIEAETAAERAAALLNPAA